MAICQYRNFSKQSIIFSFISFNKFSQFQNDIPDYSRVRYKYDSTELATTLACEHLWCLFQCNLSLHKQILQKVVFQEITKILVLTIFTKYVEEPNLNFYVIAQGLRLLSPCDK